MELETSRLILRSVHPDQAEALAAYYTRNRAFLAPFDPVREENFYTPERLAQLLAEELNHLQAGTGFRFYVFPRIAPEQIIGTVGLNNIVRGCFHSCFLGYKLDQDFLNRGYMTEAVRAAVDYAFGPLALHRVEANIMPRNQASLRVAEKCGFQPEGLARRYLCINGVWEDHLHMVRLNAAME